jgi:hypothetical protein
MDVLIFKSDAQEFEDLINEFAPAELARKPSDEPELEFEGLDLVRFLFSQSGMLPVVFVLGYWVGKDKRLILDDDGIHIMIKSPGRLLKYIKNRIEK